MVKYHGIAGMSKAEVSKFVLGRHVLVSFAYPEHMAVAAEFSSSFILDNGAFTHWRSGKGRIDYQAYVDWCYQYHRHPRFDWAIIPDVIEGTEEENNALIDAWPDDIRGIPVWHMYESLEKLEMCMDLYPVVCLGSSGTNGLSKLGSNAWWKRIDEAMQVFCDSHGRPKRKLHGLRILDPELFTKIPFSSGDSTNAVQNRNTPERFGCYIAPSEAQRAAIIADRIEVFNSPAIYVKNNHTLPLLFQ